MEIPFYVYHDDTPGNRQTPWAPLAAVHRKQLIEIGFIFDKNDIAHALAYVAPESVLVFSSVTIQSNDRGDYETAYVVTQGKSKKGEPKVVFHGFDFDEVFMLTAAYLRPRVERQYIPASWNDKQSGRTTRMCMKAFLMRFFVPKEHWLNIEVTSDSCRRASMDLFKQLCELNEIVYVENGNTIVLITNEDDSFGHKEAVIAFKQPPNQGLLSTGFVFHDHSLANTAAWGNAAEDWLKGREASR
jgi:hypothetical protein